jgi:hypothetical protein
MFTALVNLISVGRQFVWCSASGVATCRRFVKMEAFIGIDSIYSGSHTLIDQLDVYYHGEGPQMRTLPCMSSDILILD